MLKITFAHCGEYYYQIYYLIKNLTNAKIIIPPITSKKTIELGNKYSPDLICLPFKYNLGNFIEALENGANVIIHAGGGCKYGYYPEVQEHILKDLGYNFKFYNLISEHTFSIKKVYLIFKELNPKLKITHFIKTLIYSFSLMKKQANNNLEEKLFNLNIIIKRFTNASYLLLYKLLIEPFLLFKIRKYAKYNLGADAHDNIARMLYLKKHKFDGVIHIKPFGCTPEIGVINILEKVSEDINLPIMFLTQDIQDAEEGINTRIEAFNDMLIMRKEQKID